MTNEASRLNVQEQIDLYTNEIAPLLHMGFSESKIAQKLNCDRGKISRAVKRASMPNGILVQNGVDPKYHSGGWIKTDEASVRYKIEKENAEEAIKDYIDKATKGIPSPKVKKKKAKAGKNLFVYQPADIHFGKYASQSEVGHKEDMQITAQKLQDCTDRILEQAKMFNPEKQILIIGNDIVHIDNARRTTTSGTPQDTDGMWHEMIDTAVENLVIVIEKMKKITPVHIIYCPSNHDYTFGYAIAQVLKAHYRNDKNITGDFSIAHRKYHLYGKSLLGFSHGDGFKESDSDAIMATECRDKWSKSNRGYWYLGHIHHKIAKDKIGTTVEYARSLATADGWHDRNGYIGIPGGVEGYVHDKEKGQISRLSITI